MVAKLFVTQVYQSRENMRMLVSDLTCNILETVHADTLKNMLQTVDIKSVLIMCYM